MDRFRETSAATCGQQADVCGLRALPEKFRPQQADLVAADRVWESVLSPNRHLEPRAVSWISHSRPLFSLTLHFGV